MGPAILFTCSYECNFSELKMKIAVVLIYKPTGRGKKKKKHLHKKVRKNTAANEREAKMQGRVDGGVKTLSIIHEAYLFISSSVIVATYIEKVSTFGAEYLGRAD